jgi:hypothetical protein
MRTISRAKLARALAGVIALCAGGNAFAQTFPDWVSPCGAPLGIGDFANKYRLIRATAFLAPVNQLVASSPGHYRFTAQPGGLNAIIGLPVAPSTQFYGEPRMSANGRTGYLVAPDIIATASHDNLVPDNYAIVFDMRAQDFGSGCTAPDFDNIPAANIVFPPHAGMLADTLGQVPPGINANGDFAAFRLSQPVTGRAFIRLRRDGREESGDHFMFASHPERLALKVSKNVGYLGSSAWAGLPMPTFTNYGLMDGSSGGPMFNLTSGFVETSVGFVYGLGCVMPTFDSLQGAYVISNVCPESPGYNWFGSQGPHWPSYNSLNTAPITTMSQYVPAAELLVSPLGTVTQAVALGGTPPTTSFNYVLRVHPGAPAAVAYTALVEPPASGQPNLLTMTAQSGTLAIGTQLTATATVSAAGIATCGVYEQNLMFTDASHSFGDRVKHRLEVGLTDYAIDAPALTRFNGVTSPYVPTQIQYTIRNVRPTATQVRVSNSANWLRLDGQAVPGSGTLNVVYNLAAKGSPGDSAVVTVTIDSTNANALPVAESSANLTFTNIGTCLNPGAAATRTQAVVLDRRSLTITQDVLDLVPEAATETPLASLFNVPETFCVTDLEVKAGFVEYGGFFGNANFAAWKSDLDLYLTNPTGQRVRIWDRGYTPSNWPYERSSYDGSSTQVIRLNRSDRLPPSGVTLNDFVDRQAAGSWTLEAVDQVVNGLKGLEASWTLTLKGTPGACPTLD